MNMPPTSPLSTGLPDLDRLVGEVRPGEFYLWLTRDPGQYGQSVGRLITWASRMRYPTAFLDFGSGKLGPEVLSCRIRTELQDGDLIEQVTSQIAEMAEYPRSETLFLVFDDPFTAFPNLPVANFLRLLADVAPIITGNGNLAYACVPWLDGDPDHQVPWAQVVLSLHRQGDQTLLQVEKADGKFSPRLFQAHRWVGDGLEPVPIADHARVARLALAKAAELFDDKGRLRAALDSQAQREHTLSKVLENSTEAIITLDLGGFIQTWNKGAERIFDYSAENAVGRQFYTLIAAGFQAEEEIRDIIEQLRTKTYLSNLIFPAYDRKGRKLYLDVTNSTLKDTSGRPIGICLIMREITDRVLSERQLNRMVHELSLLRDLSDLLLGTRELASILRIMLIGVTSEKGLRFNRAFIMLVDRERHELYGALGTGPIDRQEAEEIWGAIKASGAVSFEELYRSAIRNQTPRDSRFDELISGIRVSLADRSHCLATLLETNEGRLIRPETSPSASALLELLGAQEACMAPLLSEGQPLGVLVADNAINHAPITDEEVQFLYLLANHAGSAVHRAHLHEELQRRLKDLERVTGELKANQERMIQFERLRTVGEMAARVAHEIRNPLAGVGGLARVLLRRGDQREFREHALEKILQEIMRLEHIIMEIQTFTRSAVLRMDVADIHDCLRAALDLAQPEIRRLGIRQIVEFDTSIPPIAHDPDRMKQVFLNLIINACQAMKAGGTVAIRTSLHPRFVQIDVTDTGEGMPPDVLEKITEPFYTTKASGSGLGVTISVQLVEAHSGFLSYASVVGQGTTATVKLPLVTSAESIGKFPVKATSSSETINETTPDEVLQ